MQPIKKKNKNPRKVLFTINTARYHGHLLEVHFVKGMILLFLLLFLLLLFIMVMLMLIVIITMMMMSIINIIINFKKTHLKYFSRPMTIKVMILPG